MRPGCFKIVDNEVITCENNAGRLIIQQYNATIGISEAMKAKLEYCSD